LRIGTLLVSGAPIIRLSRKGAEQSGDDAASVHEIGERPERGRRRCFRGWARRQVGPAGRDQRAGAVREQQEEIEDFMPPHPPEQREGLTLKRVMRSDDGDRGRETLEVGSVTPGRSTGSTRRSC
jgi:hypothetical protein